MPAFPSRFWLVTIFSLSLTGAPSAGVSAEQDPYHQAMAVRESDPPAAVRLLLQAVALDPASGKTLRALEREKVLAADWWVPRISIGSDPCQALKAVNEVLSWVPNHSGALALRKELFVLSEQRSQLAARALEEHSAGSRDACSLAMPTVSAWACMVPSAQTLASCAMVENQLVAADEALTRASGVTDTALVDAFGSAAALAKRVWEVDPSWAPARELRIRSDEVLAGACSDHLLRLSAAKDWLSWAKLVSTCGVLANAIDSEGPWLGRYQRERLAMFDRAMARLPKEIPAASYIRWRLEDALGGRLAGAPASPAQVPVVITMDTPSLQPSCSLPGLADRIGEIAKTRLEPLSSQSRPGSMPVARLMLGNLECSRSDLPDIEQVQRASSYVASYNNRPNPQYFALQRELDRVQEVIRRINQDVVNSNYDPANVLAAAIVRPGWLKQEQALLDQLASAPVTLSDPVTAPYFYTEYTHERQLAVRGAIEMMITGRGTIEPSISLDISASSRASGRRGTVHEDSNGLKDLDPPVLSWDSLARELMTSVEPRLSAALSLAVARILEALACDAAKEGASSDVIAELLLAVDLGVVDSASDLSAMRQLDEGAILATLLDSDTAITDYVASWSQACKEKIVPEGEARREGSVILQGGVHRGPAEWLLSVLVVRTASGSGSAFAVSPELLITNEHVVGASRAVEVESSDEDRFLAEVVASDPRVDLALLRVAGGGFRSLPLGNSRDLVIGDEVFVLGAPFGLSGSVTKGIVSALRKLDGVRVVQVDAAVNVGNSGGPLITSDGRVVGVNSQTIRKGIGEGIGFAVSVEEVRAAFGDKLTIMGQ